jgi:hypothetical protein
MKEKAKSPKFLIEWVDPAAKKYVTIAYTDTLGQKKYISCRRKAPLAGAMAEFRTEITDFEKFQIQFETTDKSFFFLSHNNLYLHYNHTTHHVAFKVCSERTNEDAPVKGRWLLLTADEADRTGAKTGSLVVRAVCNVLLKDRDKMSC